jgi:hypothetical protein
MINLKSVQAALNDLAYEVADKDGKISIPLDFSARIVIRADPKVRFSIYHGFIRREWYFCFLVSLLVLLGVLFFLGEAVDLSLPVFMSALLAFLAMEISRSIKYYAELTVIMNIVAMTARRGA